MGHTEILLKADNEPSTRAIQDQVKAKRPHKTILENSVRYLSQSNGFIENANKFVAGLIRTLRSFVNTKIGAIMDSNHDVITWIVRYASTLINIFHVGQDGHTSYFRRKGKNTYPVSVPICEKILFKPLSKNSRYRLERKFYEGIF